MDLKFSAYVDDISLVLPKGREPAIFSAVQAEAAHYNMQLNLAKNEVMGLGTHCPPNVSLPSLSIPPNPVTDPPNSWSPDPLPELCFGWTSHPPNPYTQHRECNVGLVPRVFHIVHLGHPLTSSLSLTSIFALVLDELEATL